MAHCSQVIAAAPELAREGIISDRAQPRSVSDKKSPDNRSWQCRDLRIVCANQNARPKKQGIKAVSAIYTAFAIYVPILPHKRKNRASTAIYCCVSGQRRDHPKYEKFCFMWGIVMRRITALVATTIALSFMSQAALAAGIAVKAGPPPPPPFTWTGCYFGAFTGYKSGGVQEYGDVTLAGAPLGSYDLIDGLAVGGEVGCQYQTGVWVFGIVADGAWTSLSGKGFPPNTDYDMTAEENWFGTVRGKLGFAINHWWGYVTGGWAWSEWKQQAYRRVAPAGREEDTQTIDGWVLGVGMDYAFTNNWVFNAEFLYIDYGKNLWYNPPDVASGICVSPVTCEWPRNIEHTNFFLKVGFKYLFNIL
jgi:outer membrane immunogenic protein